MNKKDTMTQWTKKAQWHDEQKRHNDATYKKGTKLWHFNAMMQKVMNATVAQHFNAIMLQVTNAIMVQNLNTMT